VNELIQIKRARDLDRPRPEAGYGRLRLMLTRFGSVPDRTLVGFDNGAD
jgi:hypothetical protein